MEKSAEGTGWPTLLKLAGAQKGQLFFALLLTALAVICELLPYWILFQAIDAILNQAADLPQQFLSLAGWLAVALVLKTVLYGLAYFFSHQAAFKILAGTRKQLVSQLANAPLAWLQKNPSGRLKQSVLQDVENVEMVISHHSVEVFAALLSPLLVTVFLFWIDWRLALAALAVVPLAILASTLFMRDTSAQYEQHNKTAAGLSSATVEYLRNMPVMKMFRQDSSTFQVMRYRLACYYDLITDLTQKTVPGWALFTSLLGANVLFILPVGIGLYNASEVTLSQIIMVVILGSGMLKPLLKVSRFFMEINEVLAGIQHLQPILDLTPEQAGQPVDIQQPVTLIFERVSFRYGLRSILKEIDLTFVAGSHTVILGPSGAGKSTLAQLLGGLLLPNSGRILINGTSLSTLSQQQRAALIAVASQEVFLFKGSIIDNLRLGSPHASKTEIATAIGAAQAETLIASLPDGYDTLVAEQGIRLSGGERQRIAIARALLADTPIVVLDEATASLDNQTQRAFYQGLKTHYPDKTFLIIAHRSQGREDADQIVIIEQGEIQACGTHSTLLQSNAYYQQQWQWQQNTESWSIGVPVNGSSGAQYG
ncbi:ABC transporter, ATP-binding/permease protein [Methylophaga frappieri]|uniref:ABC transporter, ATP-binding/permease protein n=1 Tax=Methylophaga frappieri (strain ATCC BAA-2434 / DSM 25690 / JAM7) TaxID=754477 RepID=I1YF65_METFJ|nr:ABC transporter ATP-binding protein [Methylophaga frappieri]AFJ01558.1 ABC transporter, ATP-binding/permease protein [Methylophaga frappieri]